jgi:hypothetical protein
MWSTKIMLQTVQSYQQQIYRDSNPTVFMRHRQMRSCVISGFRYEADEICTLLGGPRNPIFWIPWPLEDGTDKLSRNIGKELPLFVA